MADLTAYEKEILDNLFNMKSNNVLDMDKEEFLHFIEKYIDIDLDEYEEYQVENSADLFRKMCEIESNYIIAMTLKYLLEWYLEHKYYNDDDYNEEEYKYNGNDKSDYFYKKIHKYSECKRVESNLMFKDFYKIPKSQNDELNKLITDIWESLGRDIPQFIIDRLHTFTTGFLREICITHDIDIRDDKGNKYPITSLIGSIAKFYVKEKCFESEFSVVAIKSSISIFEKFNDLRNNKSYAHDNKVLNNFETEYMAKSIINTLQLIKTIEGRLKFFKKKALIKNDDEEGPF